MNVPSPDAVLSRGSTLWSGFRRWPWWGQALLWLVTPIPLLLFAGAKPEGERRPWIGIALAATVLWIGLGVASTHDGHHPERVAATAPTSTTERHVSDTPTTPPTSPEGAQRAGNGLDVSAGPATSDSLDRGTTTDALLATLDAIPVQPEDARTGYDRGLFKHWDDDDHDGCDTRCEVLTAQRRPDGTWLSEWDGYTTVDTSELQVDHVVALAEAWDSGADHWTTAQRDEFADYLPNLLAVTAAENLRKSDRDASEWFPSRADANCLWSSTVVRVKAHWALTVDQAEHDALANLLRTCPDYAAPTTTTAPPPTLPTTTAPRIVAPPPTEATPVNDCTPGYDPCIPPGPDVDCAGGSGNGPRYVDGPVSVTGDDPYGLDSDHDGVACQ